MAVQYNFFYFSLCVCVPMETKMKSDSLELQLQAVVSLQKWVLLSELGSSAKAVSALYPYTISPFLAE